MSFSYTRWLASGGVLLSILIIAGIRGLLEARSTPIVVRYKLMVDPHACPSCPLRLVLASDLHVSAWTTPPAAIHRLVGQINALRPDFVLLVGDYLGHDWPHDPGAVARAVAPLADLRPRVGTVAVLGNNDWKDGPETIAAALTRAGVHVLRNDAWVTREAAFLGIEELISNDANPVQAQDRYAAALARGGRAAPPLEFWLAHQPVMFDRVPTTGTMLFTGHSHGGQILPAVTVPVARWIVRAGQAIGTASSWPSQEYVRGPYRRGKREMLVTSGIGVSGLPLRLGVPPEIVLVSIAACPARAN